MQKCDFVEIKSSKKVTIVNILISNATLNHSTEFKNQLDQLLISGKNKVIINLSNCRYIDSSFLGAIVSNLEKFRLNEGNIKVVYSGLLIKTIFETSRINRALDTFENLDEAIKSYSVKTNAA